MLLLEQRARAEVKLVEGVKRGHLPLYCFMRAAQRTTLQGTTMAALLEGNNDTL